MRSNSNKTIDLDYASIFSSSARKTSARKTSSIPVHDKPAYDGEDAFGGLQSKSGSSRARSDKQSGGFDDLLGVLGRKEKATSYSRSSSSKGFDDMLSSISSANYRPVPESNRGSTPVGAPNHKSVVGDPFVVLESSSSHRSSSSGVFTNPPEEISSLGKSRGARVEASSGGGRGFDEVNHLNGLKKPSHSFYRGGDERGKGGSPPSKSATPQSAMSGEQKADSSFRYSGSNTEKKLPVDNFQEPPLFDMPNISTGFQKSFGPTVSSPQYFETSPRVDMSPASSGREFDDVWLTVSEIPLKTLPTTAPPPSRPPPSMPREDTRSESGYFSSSSRKQSDVFSSHSNYNQHSCSPKLARPASKDRPVPQFDARGDSRSQDCNHNSANLYSGEEIDAVSAAVASADAMKEAMEKAEAKFKHARVVREKEYVKAARNKEYVERDDVQDRHERKVGETEERLVYDRNRKEDKEREQKRLQRDMDRSRDIERDKARQAVERASWESRERAASEARLKNERAAVFKANSEARERAGRVAVQRVQAEARERAAAEVKEKAEKVAAEGREKELRDKYAKAKAEDARRRAERAAAEATVRASTGSVEMNQQRNNDDLEFLFSREPKERANSSDPFYDQQFQNKGVSEAAKRTPSSGGASSSVKRASSTTNIVDDLSSIFRAAPTFVELQEVEGETEQRRRARLDRHQLTQERTAKALAEKNQRDLQAQKEQEERHRIGETLDVEIKRWAAGKEGNLRALLSTLQYVLWPECGWQPVSLTDLIICASVKKVYRKATLCIHPDKVQQKGATLPQKYIAEKVFDLLKEAWNKFNSEELF